MDMNTIISFVLSLGSLLGWPTIIRIVMMVIETGRWAWRQWQQSRQQPPPLLIVPRGDLLIIIPHCRQSTPIVLVRRRQSRHVVRDVVRIRRRVVYLSSIRLHP